jgi:hypothetical protein
MYLCRCASVGQTVQPVTIFSPYFFVYRCARGWDRRCVTNFFSFFFVYKGVREGGADCAARDKFPPEDRRPNRQVPQPLYRPHPIPYTSLLPSRPALAQSSHDLPALWYSLSLSLSLSHTHTLSLTWMTRARARSLCLSLFSLSLSLPLSPHTHHTHTRLSGGARAIYLHGSRRRPFRPW